jgi:hypothetical protein
MTTMENQSLPPIPDDIDQLFQVVELSPNPKVDPPPFVDLVPIFGGDMRQESPTIAQIRKGRQPAFLLYAGRINELHAAPSVGKTNVGIAATILTLLQNKQVLIIDPEDTPPGYVRRLSSFGCPAEFASQINYLHNPSPEEIESSIRWAQENAESLGLVFIDGMAEIMAAAGLSEDGAADCIAFLRQYVRPFADAGIAVLISDHVVKSTENRGGFSRGSGAKMGRYDGIVYEVTEGKNYTPNEAGFVRLKIAKDRQGGVGPRGKVAYEVHFTPKLNDELEHVGTAFEFKIPTGPEDFRPTAIMGKVVDHLKTFDSSTTNEITNAIPSKRSDVLAAIKVLLHEKTLKMEQKGQSKIYSLAQKSEGIVIHDY